MQELKCGDKVRINQAGIIKEITYDDLGTRYLIKELNGDGFWSARNPKEIELIEGAENGS